MTHFHGTSGDDDIIGTRRADHFDMSQGGNDTVVGGGGKDYFYFGAALTADDQINGGKTVFDPSDTQKALKSTVELNGDYSAGVIFGEHTMINVATLLLDGGHSYNLTFNQTTVGFQGMTVDASTLQAGTTLILDDSAGTGGKLVITSNASHTTIVGGAGYDTFNLGNNLNASDHIDGGGGFNTLSLSGTYGPLVLGPSNIMHVSSIVLGAGTYTFTADDAFESGGTQLQFNLTGSVHLDFDGSAETTTSFQLGRFTGSALGGGGNDVIFSVIGTVDGGGGDDTLSSITGMITGGDGNDVISNCSNIINGGDGDDSISSSSGTINGGAGNDSYSYSSGTFDAGTGDDFFSNCTGTFDLRESGRIYFDAASGGSAILDMGASLSSDDFIFGTDGNETVILDGDYSAGVVFSSTLVNVDMLQLTAGHSYSFTADGGILSKNVTMTVDGSTLGETDMLYFNGAASTSGKFVLLGGAGDDVLTCGVGGSTLNGGIGEDTLTGGAGSDTLIGGDNRDTLNGGSGGNDSFIYTSATESTGIHFDTIVGFDVTRDSINTPVKVTGIDTEIIGGTLDNLHGVNQFNQELGAAVNGHLLAGHAILFAPDSGSLAGDLFLVVDQNGVAGYQAGEDLVIEISGSNVTSLTTQNFHH